MPDRCPVCGSSSFQLAVPGRSILDEINLRERFIRRRLPANPEHGELKDLLDFMHDEPADLRICSGCGLLRRIEAETKAAAGYEDDVNDPAAMAVVYPRYLQFFRQKEKFLRPMLSPNARVLEVGSHLGAFLQAAEEWSWRASGLDTGIDTAAFVKRLGLDVRRAMIEEARLEPSAHDAVFIWNCFEQILEPYTLLAQVRRTLAPHGLLLVRVPNITAYLILRDRAWSDKFARRVLEYNNLLGFPYLYGHSEATLDRLMAQAGFIRVRSFDSELVTMPFVEPAAAIRDEQLQISRASALWTARTHITGPWIERVYRRLTDNDWWRYKQGHLKPEPDRHTFLPRAA